MIDPSIEIAPSPPSSSSSRRLLPRPTTLVASVASIPFAIRTTSTDVSSASTSSTDPSGLVRRGTVVRTSAQIAAGAPKRQYRKSMSWDAMPMR